MSNGALSRGQERMVWLLVGAGVALRAIQLAGGASLWLDEIALARNITDRGYAALLQPLAHAQVAPPAFLLVERFFWTLLRSDVSLRILPFVGSVISLVLMRQLARRVLSGVAVPLAVGALALALPHIMFAGQVKQYSTDVTCALALLLLAARLVEPRAPTRHYVHAALGGLVAVWFSNASVLVITGLGAGLALLALRGRVPRRQTILFVILPWVVAAGLASLAARHAVSPDTMTFMKAFWQDAFAPIPPHSVREVLWPWYRLLDLFDVPWGLRYRFAPLYGVLTLAGIVVLWIEERDRTTLLLGPVVVTLFVAVAHLYPFEGRLVLFLTPVILIALAAAVATIARWLGTRSATLAAAFVVLVSIPPIERILVNRPTYRLQETESLLRWLATQRRDGDVIYTWYRAVPNVDWYGPSSGIAERDRVNGGCWLSEPRRLLRDMEPLRGKPRVWIVLTGTSFAEAKLMLAYADSLGTRRGGRQMSSSFPRYHLDAWLYDFSDSTRLARTSAEQFPIALKAPAITEAMACSVFFDN